MVKQLTCALSTVQRAASEQGILLSYGVPPGIVDPNADVTARPSPADPLRAVALSAHTLAGQLFLSLLMVGAV